VNPKNSYYDKFYIINYLELGKRWLDVIAEDFEDTMPTFADSDEEIEEETWKEWCEEKGAEEERTQALCLFCQTSSEMIEELLDHIRTVHDIDLIAAIERDKLSSYDRIKMLNFIRKEAFNNPKSRSTDADTSTCRNRLPDRELWDKEEELIPMFGNDHLPWMLESYLFAKEEKELIDHINKDGENQNTGKVDPDPDHSSQTLSKEKLFKEIVEESMKSTVEQVIAEDLPESLAKSVLREESLYNSLL